MECHCYLCNVEVFLSGWKTPHEWSFEERGRLLCCSRCLHCHGEVCTVDAPVAFLSGFTLRCGHYVLEPFASDSQMFAVRALLEER